MKEHWYQIENINDIDSPALVVYRERVAENIQTAIKMTGNLDRLRPHVKTHKSKEVADMMIEAGINKFKCATIAEAEMLGMSGAPDVLLAYQPFGPKQKRFIDLIKKYPGTKYSCLIDNLAVAKSLACIATNNDLEIAIYLDLNVGMNRTGIAPGREAIDLYLQCSELDGILPAGLHAYDGHIRSTDINERISECDKAFAPVVEMQQELMQHGFPRPILIAGGSPTFPVHAKKNDRECSPGTFIYWDKGYESSFPDQRFLTAALVISRIISFPGKGKICLDLGHKSIAAENTLEKRVTFLNAPGFKFIGQSEEHLIVQAEENHSYKVGDVFYGLPYHICPTVALYERALIAENGMIENDWKVIARDRKINV
ncbi:MAG: D-TA family PLP-dependent enzyme [Ginsengibacter sp.]